MKDKNGVEIKEHDMVNVPDPNDTDIHHHAFSGAVVHIYPEGSNMVTVEDGDNNLFDIEANRVEIETD